MRVLRTTRIVAELIVVTLALWLVLAVVFVFVLPLVGHSDTIWVIILAGLFLWWGFRWAVPTVDWIERRLWDDQASTSDQLRQSTHQNDASPSSR
jgi:chromate transport protein ChrA